MKNKILFSFFLVVCLFVLSSNIFARQSTGFSVGVTLGGKWYSHSGEIEAFPDPNFPKFSGSDSRGQGNAYTVGLALNYIIPGFNNVMSINSKIYYDAFDMKDEMRGSLYPHIINKSGIPTSVDVTTNHNLFVKLSYVSADLTFKYNFWKNLGVVAGPSFGFLTNSNFQQNYFISSPVGLKFSDITDWYAGEKAFKDEKSSIEVLNGEIKDVNKYRYGLIIGLQLETKLDRFWFVSYYTYNLPLNSISNYSGYGTWKLNNQRLGLDIRYEI